MSAAQIAPLVVAMVVAGLCGFRAGELRARDRVLDFLDFFAGYLRDGNARFHPDSASEGPAALVDELAKSIAEEL